MQETFDSSGRPRIQKEGSMSGTLTQIGDRLPEVTLPRLDGAQLNFESLRGKRHLLFFWGSW